MNFVSAPDFVYQYNISGREKREIANEIDWYVTKYQPILLNQLLGADLYNSLITGLAVVSPDVPAVKWTKLRDQIKLSVLCFSYWHIRAENATQTGPGSEMVPTNENAVALSPDEKMMKRWNEMVDNNFASVNFVLNNPTDYPGYISPFNQPLILNPSTYRGIDCILPDIFTKQTWL